MRRLSNNEVKQLQLEIMDFIHDFCNANNLRYSLGYGTLIGAVRHNGFIPWDDDLDIIMPRPDYEIFLSSFQGKYSHLDVEDYSTDSDYISAFAKVSDNRTFAIGPNIIDDRRIFIDIFPIDGMLDGDEANSYENLQKIMNDLRRGGKYWKYTESIKEKFLFFIKYHIKKLKTDSLAKNFAKLHQIISKCKFGESEYAGCLVSLYGYKRERLRTEIFLKYKDIQFETRTYKCIEDYDAYLRNIYGDYMKLPPVEARVGMHYSEVYLVESEKKSTSSCSQNS